MARKVKEHLCNTCGEENKNKFRYEKKSICRSCENTYQKQHNKDKKESIGKYQKQYYKANKESIGEYQKKYRQDNKVDISEANKRYRQENKEYFRKYYKQYEKQRLVSDNTFKYLKNIRSRQKKSPKR